MSSGQDLTKIYLDKLPLLDAVNAEILKGYVRRQLMRQLQPSSIQDKVWRAYYFLKFAGFRDAREVRKEDLENYILFRRGTVSPRTLQGDLIELKVFFRYLLPDRMAELFPADERIVKAKIDYGDPLTREQVRQVVQACDTTRDRALVMFLWDTGARLSEALDQNIGDIHIDQTCGNTTLRGKTGAREAWLVDCLPSLQDWLNVHPHKADPDAPLFLTYSRYGFGTRRLNKRTVQNLCKTLAKRAGVPADEVHPHALRHARATDRAKAGYTEMEMRIMFGWSKSSNMPAVYIHLSGRDVKHKILEKAGLVEAVPAGPQPLEMIKCTRCGLLNDGDAIYCKRCSMGLSDEVRRMMMQQQQLITQNAEYQESRKRVTTFTP